MSFIECEPTCCDCGRIFEEYEEIFVEPADDDFDTMLYTARCAKCQDKHESESDIDA